jgi:hypothetical protein
MGGISDITDSVEETLSAVSLTPLSKLLAVSMKPLTNELQCYIFKENVYKKNH